MSAASAEYARTAFDLIKEFDRLKTPEAVVERLASALSTFGYTSFLINGTPEPPQRVEPYFLANGWPHGWPQDHANENHYAVDPVAAWGRRAVNPFAWSDAVHDLAHPPPATVTTGAQGRAMRKGYLVPIMRVIGSTSCVTMAGERPEFEPHARDAAHLVGLAAHARAVSLVGCPDTARPRSVLAMREREVLHWVAAGKSSWDVSVIVGIPERSVNWLISSATRKLNAVNRTQAVANAIRLGEIFV